MLVKNGFWTKIKEKQFLSKLLREFENQKLCPIFSKNDHHGSFIKGDLEFNYYIKFTKVRLRDSICIFDFILYF